MKRVLTGFVVSACFSTASFGATVDNFNCRSAIVDTRTQASANASQRIQVLRVVSENPNNHRSDVRINYAVISKDLELQSKVDILGAHYYIGYTVAERLDAEGRVVEAKINTCTSNEVYYCPVNGLCFQTSASCSDVSDPFGESERGLWQSLTISNGVPILSENTFPGVQLPIHKPGDTNQFGTASLNCKFEGTIRTRN
jgi:hypothetical protein